MNPLDRHRLKALEWTRYAAQKIRLLERDDILAPYQPRELRREHGLSRSQ